jgi:hypothetical protein
LSLNHLNAFNKGTTKIIAKSKSSNISPNDAKIAENVQLLDVEHICKVYSQNITG